MTKCRGIHKKLRELSLLVDSAASLADRLHVVWERRMSHKKKVSRGRVSTNSVLVAIVLCALVMTTLLTGLARPAWAASDDSGQSASSAQSRAVTTGANRIADTATYNEYTLGDEDSTQYNGRVWVDKSVSTEANVSFGDMNVTNNSDYLVTYSALATSTIEVGQTPTDTVFILDLSASMTWGYSESGHSVSQGESRLQAMVNAMNSAIDTLVKANPQNRIAIVTFNGSCTAGQALMPTLMTGEEILEQVKDGQYLEIRNYDQRLNIGPDKATADVYCAATRLRCNPAYRVHVGRHQHPGRLVPRHGYPCQQR